jgi:hypothetical protein
MIMQGEVLQAGRREVLHLRVQLLPDGAHQQRRRQRLDPVHVGEGHQHRVDPDDAQLGSQVAVQLAAQRQRALLHSHHHRRPDAVHQQRRARLVDFRHELHQQPAVLVLADLLVVTDAYAYG